MNYNQIKYELTLSVAFLLCLFVLLTFSSTSNALQPGFPKWAICLVDASKIEHKKIKKKLSPLERRLGLRDRDVRYFKRVLVRVYQVDDKFAYVDSSPNVLRGVYKKLYKVPQSRCRPLLKRSMI